MAEQKFKVNCGFFDSISGNNLYSASDMNRPYDRLITEGVFATPQGTASNDLQVYTANDELDIIVKKGNGYLGKKWFENPADLRISITPNSNIVNRIDSIIMQVNKNQSELNGSIVYREGSYATNTEPPALENTENITEMRLANILVSPQTSLIGQEMITDLRGSSECPWITHLIKQVDTSTLYEQYRAAFQKYYDDETSLFNAFMDQLTDQLIVNTSIIELESRYISSQDNVTEVPIGIEDFSAEKDVLIVFVNGIKKTTTIDYTLSEDETKIILINAINSNQVVDILVLKSVIIGDNEQVLSVVQSMANKVNGLQATITDVNSNLNNIFYQEEGEWELDEDYE